MLCASFLPIVVLSLAGIPVCLADISLILPDFDPQPLSVNIIGVGANGETTYEMFPGQPTGTFVGQDPAFIDTATLIEGPNNVVFQDAEASLTESCLLANGMADCIVAVLGQTTFSAQYDAATPLVVQGGGTASPAPTGAVRSGVSAQTTPAPGGSVPESSATTQTASPSISPSRSASSGVRLTPGLAGLAGMWVISAVLA